MIWFMATYSVFDAAIHGIEMTLVVTNIALIMASPERYGLKLKDTTMDTYENGNIFVK